MKKLKNSNEMVINVKTESQNEFFARGKLIAEKLDRGMKHVPQSIISFEDPEDLVKFLTQTKRDLLAAIRKKPTSITGLSNLLHRSRAAVDKDIQMLESVGIVESEYVPNPGHGICRMIKTKHMYSIKLQVETII